MGTGYTRNDTGNNIADGNIINASDLDGEFDAVESAFNSSTGHTHDGTSAEGGPITKLGPVQDLVVSASAVTPKTDNTLDLGSSSLEFKDGFFDGTVNIDSLVADTADINGGSVDGVTVGTNSAVTDLRVDNIKVDGNAITSTDTNGNIALTPNGTGEVDISKVDIAAGEIDGVTIGTNSAVTDLRVDNIKVDGNTISSTNTNGNINITPNGSGAVAFTTNATFGDNDKANFGAGTDMSIYHDGSNSYIDDSGTGSLNFRGSQVNIGKYTGEDMVTAVADGAVTLFHNNSAKIATTSTGVDVTGTSKSDLVVIDSTGGATPTYSHTNNGEGITLRYNDDSGARAADIVATGNNPAGATTAMRFFVNPNSTDAASEVMRIQNNNVGIGTTSPETILHATASSAIIRLTSDANGTSGVDFGDSADTNIGRLLYDNSDNSMRLTTNASERMRIDSSGNVGIGATSPATTAHIQTSSGNPELRIESTGANYATMSVKNSSRHYSTQIRTDQSNAFVIRDETGGANRFFIDTSGNVGIGTSPTAPLHLNTSASGDIAIINTSANSGTGLFINSQTANQIDVVGYDGSAANAVNIRSGGASGAGLNITTANKIGIGTNSPSQKFVVSNAGADNIVMAENSSASIQMFMQAASSTGSVGTLTNHPVQFLSNNTERMRLHQGGDLSLGTTTATGLFNLENGDNGEPVIQAKCTSTTFNHDLLKLICSRSGATTEFNAITLFTNNTDLKFLVRPDGDLENANNSYGALSDQNLKENIVDAGSQWDDLKALRVRKYNLIGETATHIGVVAQEVEAAGMGGLVALSTNTETQETHKSMKYSVLYMKAIKALQEAMTRIETLETQNTIQATQIADLITRVTALETGE